MYLELLENGSPLFAPWSRFEDDESVQIKEIRENDDRFTTPTGLSWWFITQRDSFPDLLSSKRRLSSIADNKSFFSSCLSQVFPTVYFELRAIGCTWIACCILWFQSFTDSRRLDSFLHMWRRANVFIIVFLSRMNCIKTIQRAAGTCVVYKTWNTSTACGMTPL
jgi:hypothetical protein